MKTVSKFNISPAHHRAFINSIEEHKLPKVDFGF